MFKKPMKLVLLVIAGIIGIIWFIVAVGFGYFGLLGFLASSSQKGFRETLCGSSGCTDLNFFFSVLWLIGMVSVIYLLPMALVLYFIRKRARKLN
ncbi:hypothetical protein AB6A23_09335 [Paenibacillus tarimensis]